MLQDHLHSLNTFYFSRGQIPIPRRAYPRVYIEETIAENPPPVCVFIFPANCSRRAIWLEKLLGPIWSTAPLAVCALEFLWRNERDRGKNLNEYSNRGSVFCAPVKQKNARRDSFEKSCRAYGNSLCRLRATAFNAEK